MDQRGWAVAGQVSELPSPVRVLALTLEIEGSDRDGYLLLCDSEDHSIWGDWWYETVALAEEAAADEDDRAAEPLRCPVCVEGCWRPSSRRAPEGFMGGL